MTDWPDALDTAERETCGDPPVDDTMRGQSLGAAAVVPLAGISLALGNDTDSPSHHIATALRALRRATRCDRLGYQRNGYLDEASTALTLAGFTGLAARIDAAAEPFGGGWADAERVEQELSEMQRGGR